jgi:hypothetical protein
MGTFGGGLAVGMSMVQPSGGGAAIPDVTVATSQSLPTTRPDGHLVTVTAESGLSADTVVQWDDGAGVWLMLWTTTTSAPPRDGEWYSSGGITVESAEGAQVRYLDLPLRWAGAVTVDASAGGGTRAMWLHETAYAGTPVIWGWLLGTEANAAARLAQGFTDVLAGTGTLTETSGYMRAAGSGAVVSAFTWTLTSGVSASTKYYYSYEYRGEAGAGSGLRWIGSRVSDGARTSFFASPAAAAPAFSVATTAVVAYGDARRDTSPAALPDLSSDPDRIDILDEGRTVLATAWRNGQTYHVLKRNNQSLSQTAALFGVAHGSATGTQTADFRHVTIMTY